MPNIITHTIFCEEVYKNIENKKYKEIIMKHRKEYLIGTNGPDYLFFHGAFPIYKKHDLTIPSIGTKFHQKKINAFYKSAITTYRKQPKGVSKDAMASYIIGHYLHWQLDSIMHPYVVYITGFGKPYNKFHHHRMESMMDTIHLKKYRNETIQTYQTFKNCKRSRHSTNVISKVYINAIKECFDIDVTIDEIKKSLMDWEKAQKLLYDPKRRKYRLLKVIEWVIRKPWLLTGNIVLTKIDDRYDIMNEKHEEWLHPCSGEPSNESVENLWNKALQEAQIGLSYLFDALDKKPMKPLLNFIGNKTYANGISGKVKRMYQNDIYER